MLEREREQDRKKKKKEREKKKKKAANEQRPIPEGIMLALLTSNIMDAASYNSTNR